jgi:hypothetical protein
LPTTTNLALPYPSASDTADVPRDIQTLANRLDIVAGGPAVSSLPGSPVDGQECYYVADAANGVVWHLRYRAGATGSYKWEFVGGAQLTATGAGGATSSTTPQTAGTPTITLPLAGDYELGFGAFMQPSATGTAIVTLFDDGVATALTMAKVAIDGFEGSEDSTFGVLKAIGAASAMNARYNSQSGSGIQVQRQWMAARPVRVG